MLDSDLDRLYQVETRGINEAVKNNEGAIQWKEWTLGENGYPVFAQ